MHREQKRNYRIKCIGVFVALIILVIIAFLIFYTVTGEVSSVDYVSLLISAFAFFFSAFNFLRMEKPAEIEVFPGENIVIIAGIDKVGLHIPMTFLNHSYTAGVITRCELEIEDVEGHCKSIKWDSFCKDQGSKWELGGMVYPIAIAGKSSFTKVVTFLAENKCDNNNILNLGINKIIFKIWMPGEMKTHYTTRAYNVCITDKLYINILKAKEDLIMHIEDLKRCIDNKNFEIEKKSDKEENREEINEFKREIDELRGKMYNVSSVELLE